MRTCHAWLLCGTALAILAGNTPDAPGHVIIFKDGFTFSGQIKSPHTIVVDPPTGKVVLVANGDYWLETNGRVVRFSPQQVQDVLDKDVYQAADIVSLESNPLSRGRANMYPLNVVLGGDPWNEHWDRNFRFVAPYGGQVTSPQHLAFLSPFYARVDSRKFNWFSYYQTSELGPSTVRTLLYTYPGLKTGERNDPAWRFKVYRFFVQAGWYDQAEEELNAILKDSPDEKEKVETAREALKRLRALQLYDDIQLAHQAGQFQWVQKQLGRFPREGVNDKALAAIRALKATYETNGESLELARGYLRELPRRCPLAHRETFQKAAGAILAELDLGNVSRLEAFLSMAQQAKRDKQNGKTPKEPEEILSLAVSGWLLGKDAAEAKVEEAKRLWKAREFVLKYQGEDDETAREQLLKNYLSAPSDVLPIDELTQIIGFLPPPKAEKDPAGTLSLRTDLPDGPKKGIPYVVQLPPEYHHGRAFPVLFALHHTGERPEAMLARVSAMAAKHGYIVVAPEWDKVGDSAYQFTAEEHAAVTDVLRDLRRRFQVDSDRVFLMGAGQGGNMAFDVGLSHPDLFAGVLPVSGWPGRHGQRYWPNCLDLPFYIVDGDLADHVMGNKQVQGNLQLFQNKWVKLGYPVLYVLYKGRGVEWFAGELPSMFDWMDHKRDRHRRALAFPRLAKSGGTLDQRFQCLRTTDNHFYWLSTNGIDPKKVNDGTEWHSDRYGATFQAWALEGNIINVNPTNIKQLTVWLSKEMIDFPKPVTIRINGSPRWWNHRQVQPSLKTLLEDFYERGDRQRLFWARLDFKL
jgi:acetyl esterase/lipase